MGYDMVFGPDTYGSGCMPGTTRQFKWWREEFLAGTLGCYNPASLGGRSLHAEGRAMDIALDAFDPVERAAGDAIFDLVMKFPELFGAQEMLWRGFIWSWQRRGEGKRGPGIQQRDHENHVHLGIDVEAAKFWIPERVKGIYSKPEPEKPKPRRRPMEGQIYTFIDQKDEQDIEVSVQHMGGTAHDKDNYMRLLPAETFAKVAANGAVPIRLFRQEFDLFVAGNLDDANFAARSF